MVLRFADADTSIIGSIVAMISQLSFRLRIEVLANRRLRFLEDCTSKASASITTNLSYPFLIFTKSRAVFAALEIPIGEHGWQ